VRIYDVVNAARRGCWVIAEDEAEALTIALKNRHLKKVSNAEIYDITDRMLEKDSAKEDLVKLIELGKPGRLSKRVPTITFEEMLKGEKPGASKWLVQPIDDKLYDCHGNTGDKAKTLD